MSGKLIIVSTLIVSCICQRPPYAGKRPIGYPALEAPSTSASTDDLGNRFGEGDGGTTVSTTTQRLPIEALGDKDLVDRLSKLPVDKQPFWFINWKAYEAHRKKPQTYPQKVNPFIESNFSQQQAQMPNQFFDQTQNRFGQTQNNQDQRPLNSMLSSGQTTQNANSFNGLQIQQGKRPQNFHPGPQNFNWSQASNTFQPNNFENGMNNIPQNQGMLNSAQSQDKLLTNIYTQKGLQNRFKGESQTDQMPNTDKVQSQKRRPEYTYQ